MSANSLLYPDHPDWYAERAHSSDVARSLIAAYAVMKQGAHQAQSFLDAYAILDPILRVPMSRQQRMHVSYVASLRFAALGDTIDALNSIDDALEIALTLNDIPSTLELLMLRGNVNRGALYLRDAVDDYSDCLALLREQEERTGDLDAEAALGLLAQLGGFEFHLKHYDTAQRHLDEARRLIPLASGRILDAATVEWMQSHLFRWSNQPERALRPALAAAEVFTEHGTPASAGRAQTSVAELYLDFAEVLSDGTDRYGMLRQAKVHIRLALALAREAHDSIGEALAQLAAIRHSRLARLNCNRMNTIERTVSFAERRGDIALQAQANTALGDELAATGDLPRALDVYRRVVALLDESDVPALDMRAQRTLLYAQEYH